MQQFLINPDHWVQLIEMVSRPQSDILGILVILSIVILAVLAQNHSGQYRHPRE